MMKTYKTHSKRPSRVVLMLMACLALLWLPVRAARGEPAQLRLTPAEAVVRALQHNLSLQVERANPKLSTAAEDRADAAFEPELFAAVDGAHSPGAVSSQRAGLDPKSSTSVGGELGLRKSFSTGTSLELSLSTKALYGGGSLDPSYQSGAALTARQSLLAGISRAANEVDLRTARLEREEARRTLQRKAEQVAAETLDAYFDLQSALAKDHAQAQAEQVARATHAETLLLIKAGRLAGSEELSARYTLQTQKRARLQSRQAVADARDKLARLMGLVQPESLATPEIVTVQTATELPDAGQLEELQQAALKGRGDYLAALDKIKAQQLKVNAARHRLLPKLDLVGSLFLTGISGEPGSASGDGLEVDRGYWASFQMNRPGWAVGLELTVPLGNGAARSAVQTAELELRRAKASARLLLQGISQELNVAWRALEVAREQLSLTRTAEQVAQQKLTNEEARYRAGKTTAHILASVQADANKERQARVQAEADLSKALVKLHSTAGTLLARIRLPEAGA